MYDLLIKKWFGCGWQRRCAVPGRRWPLLETALQRLDNIDEPAKKSD